MIVITGARGFIGSILVEKLNQEGLKNLILVDELENEAKNPNIENLEFEEIIHRNDFLDWFTQNHEKISFVYHLGARTDTAEMSEAIFDELNLNYSQKIWQICSERNIPLVYASSAATYGDGENGYNDEKSITDLQPLNPYGWSKQDFDLWAEKQNKKPPFYAGLKFFNVYGPNEYHKGRMASVIFHAYHQISKTGAMKLFQSHKNEYENGEQQRDFIYVKDLVDVCFFLYKNRVENGIYNLGTGTARSFNDLVKATFDAMNLPADISYIPTPIDIRDKYQYFTEATMQKLKNQGYQSPFHSLEDGVADYVKNHLSKR